MASSISKEIQNLLEDAVRDKIENFHIIVEEGANKVNGFLSEQCFVSLRNKTTDENHHFIIKQAISSAKTAELMSRLFRTEIYFYTTVIPTLTQFQKSLECPVFNHIATFYSCTSEPEKQKLVLENLKYKNYRMHHLSSPLSVKNYEFIFKLFGKLHGISFAFKHHKPEEFAKLASPLKGNLVKQSNLPILSDLIKKNFETIQEMFQEVADEKLRKKLEYYVRNGVDIFKERCAYKGDYAVIVHGDSWSNNMLFKYNSIGDLEDVKLIDFQISDVCSPVHDLAYTLYSGASKEAIDQIEHLRKIYYQSLSNTIIQLKCDPEVVFPYERFIEEWKEYSVHGYLIGSAVWGIRCADDDSELNAMDEDGEIKQVKKNEKKFREVLLYLTEHMLKNDYL